MGNTKRPYRLAFLLAVGAIALLTVSANALPGATYQATPGYAFRPLLISGLRTDRATEAAPVPTAAPVDDVVLDQPWPEVQPQPPAQPPPPVRQPKPKSEPIQTPRPNPPRVRVGNGQVHGVATWYCNVGPPFPSRCTVGYSHTGAYAAAGPELRRALGNWRGKYVYVNGVRVRLIDWCACGGDHVIDVYHDTWVRIPRQSNVTISW